MITREELISTKEYWLTQIQNELFRMVDEYLETNNMNRTQFADKIGVTKGYVSQVLNGDFNHRISKFVELSLSIGKVPIVEFKDLNKIIEEDKNNNNETDKHIRTNGTAKSVLVENNLMTV